mmetsp:Transcript_4657/g.9080  ORF Transcript_4657/g.9080 Transcript_4657/m.9080 type:complete len:116 (-) Transcript_4657:97-444(-)
MQVASDNLGALLDPVAGAATDLTMVLTTVHTMVLTLTTAITMALILTTASTAEDTVADSTATTTSTAAVMELIASQALLMEMTVLRDSEDCSEKLSAEVERILLFVTSEKRTRTV